jgi:hypothetical protein
MSVIDKVVAAMTPAESNASQQEARSKAKAAAKAGDWLSMVLDHHQQIDAAFARVKAATDSAARVAEQKHLAVILTGHSIAEENVLYPALASVDEKAHATMAYTQQAVAKLEMGLLEKLSPMSQEYLDKLEHIRAAVAHHVYEEEGTWFIDLHEKLAPSEQVKLASRYKEEFDRYVGSSIQPMGARRVA